MNITIRKSTRDDLPFLAQLEKESFDQYQQSTSKNIAKGLVSNFQEIVIVENEENIKFGYETIAKDDFLEEINALSRITCADVFVDKQLLGGDSLNYSERLSSIKHEIITFRLFLCRT